MAIPVAPTPKTKRRSAYLVARELREGDVVLTSASKLKGESNWRVRAIRPMTLSMYTHASVMMTRLGMLEANGSEWTSRISIQPLRRHGRDLLIDLDSPRALVLRPTEAGFARAGGEAVFRKKISSTVLAYLGREYSHEVDLLDATWFSLARRLFKTSHPTLLDRWSCSGLVAQTYLDAGLDLVSRDVRRAAPGTFIRSPLMCKVPTAVRRLSEGLSPGPLRPLDGIAGKVSVEDTELKVANAVRNVSTSGPEAAADALDRDLNAMLCAPSGLLLQQYRFEDGLVKEGLL